MSHIDRLRWLEQNGKLTTLDGASEVAKRAPLLLAEIEHLMRELAQTKADLATFGKDTEADENRIIDAEFRAAAMERERDEWEQVAALENKMRCKAERERDEARAAVWAAIPWLDDLEHMGSIVDQKRLSETLAKLRSAVSTHEQSTPAKEG